MRNPVFYGAGFPYRELQQLPGRLVVLEGSDGVGRSTQIKQLRRWLEDEGYAVSDTGLARSTLTQGGIDEAKRGHTLGPFTMSLFYAADFADRLENQIIPAMQAGFVVLSDRYFYSVIARDCARGVDPEWARKLYGIALKPDLVLYLRASVPTLVSRLIHGRGLNYWEAGMDIHMADNLYDSFVHYQTKLNDIFDDLVSEYNFVPIDADRSVDLVFEELKSHIQEVLYNRQPKTKKPH